VETDGRFHSNWLNMMYSRLLIARQLLREDGVIFISIDDNEVHHLRKLCDEVFGEENFMANIVWQKKYAATNDAQGFSPMHDHIIVYRKSELFERNLLPRTEEQNKPYVNDDHNGKGLWRSDNLLVKSFSESGVFPIQNPNTGKEYYPPKGSSWRGSKNTIDRWLEEGRIFFGKDGKGAPQLKRYLNEVQQGRVPTTWWTFNEVGHNDGANKEMQNLFDSKSPFDTPKPSKLLKHIFNIAIGKNDVVLDFFSGSGTTGQAITELNKDEGNRKFILVQLPEATDPKSEAYKVGFKKISDITIERNKRVIEKIIEEKKNEQPDLFDKKEDNENQLNGLGFKVFKLTKSNFPRVEYAPDPEKSDEENVEALKKYIADKEAQLITAFNRDELITEILIKNGFKLNYTITQQDQFKKNEIFLASDGEKETLLCLDGTLSDETVEYFKSHTDQKLIVLERALDTTKKWNLKHYMGDKFKAF
jgi:adenine-specific DNA-methyltransferase